MNHPLVLSQERCDIEEGFPTTRPIPTDGGPTELHVSLFLFDLVEVVTVKQEFTLDFFIHIRWKDPRVGEILRKAGVNACQLAIDQVWFPNLLLVNSRQHRTDLPRIPHLSDDGTIKGNQRILGTFAVQMNLEDFPLDAQVLPVTFSRPHIVRRI